MENRLKLNPNENPIKPQEAAHITNSRYVTSFILRQCMPYCHDWWQKELTATNDFFIKKNKEKGFLSYSDSRKWITHSIDTT